MNKDILALNNDLISPSIIPIYPTYQSLPNFYFLDYLKVTDGQRNYSIIDSFIPWLKLIISIKIFWVTIAVKW